MEKRKIKVIIKEPYKDPVVSEIVDDLKTIQKIVGGYIEVVPFPNVKGVDLVVNEEGKLEKLPGNFFIPHYEDCIVGSCMITGYNDEGEFASLADKQIEKVNKYIKTFEIPKEYDLYYDLDILQRIMNRKMKEFDKDESLC